MRLPTLLGCLCVATCLWCAPVGAQEAQPPASAAQHPTHPKSANAVERGWFFYDDPLPEKPPVKRRTSPITPPHAAVPPPPPVGSVAWIAANIDRIRDNAIDNPTKDNVELFGYVQKLMMDKSQRFADVFVRSMAANPALDETGSHPVSTYGTFTASAIRAQSRRTALEKLGASTAIWYFFRSDCPYCHRQSPLLQDMTAKDGFPVLPISLDGLPLQNGAYANEWVVDGGQGRLLGVTATPTMYLVHPPNDVVFLAAGLRATPELEDRVLDVARSNGWLSEAEYEKAMMGLPQRYLTTNFDPTQIINPDDPAQVLAALRAAGLHAGVQSETLQSLTPATSGNSTPWNGKD